MLYMSKVKKVTVFHSAMKKYSTSSWFLFFSDLQNKSNTKLEKNTSKNTQLASAQCFLKQKVIQYLIHQCGKVIIP